MEIPVTFEIADEILTVRFAQHMLTYYTEDLREVSAYNNADKRTKDGRRYNAALKRYQQYKQELQDAVVKLGTSIAGCTLQDAELRGLMEDVIAHPENYKS